MAPLSRPWEPEAATSPFDLWQEHSLRPTYPYILYMVDTVDPTHEDGEEESPRHQSYSYSAQALFPPPPPPPSRGTGSYHSMNYGVMPLMSISLMVKWAPFYSLCLNPPCSSKWRYCSFPTVCCKTPIYFFPFSRPHLGREILGNHLRCGGAGAIIREHNTVSGEESCELYVVRR